MNSLKLDALNIETMYSGGSCLNLTSSINWEDFPAYAKSVIDLLNGSIEKKTDSIDIRVWEVTLEQEKFYLTYDDFPVMVSLESLTPKGDALLAEFKIKIATSDS
ncbi:DUF3630 family protein [Pseudomonas sp. NPDC089996]|uniref:DUF3630 family protein n=1 Tax=Pseudomonas sp. NPDC089996 TaxID=3364474 RepID=UPI003818A98D